MYSSAPKHKIRPNIFTEDEVSCCSCPNCVPVPKRLKWKNPMTNPCIVHTLYALSSAQVQHNIKINITPESGGVTEIV